MCGLIALLGASSSTFALETLQPALTYMHRRDPDAEGTWQEPGVWLGHRRLSILDLDIRSNQPLHSACGRYVIVFNGEIYNYRALRGELVAAGVPLHTTSDTEVILELFAHDGAAVLPRLRCMFAFVIWDRTARHAFAARDPYGIKPLYWAHTADGVLLASQVRALLDTGQVSRAPCARGQAGFWLLGSVPEPHTWYQAIQALPAGHCAWIDEGRMGSPQRWWDVAAAWRDAPDTLRPAAEVRERVRTALRASLAAHLVADVPVGLFLSGGIDSGALAGLMVEAGAQNLQGITISYDEFACTHADEAPVAASLAAHYGISHHVNRVTREEFAADLPRILAAMDLPSVDGINTWYATKAVAELELKVVVSDVGGSELFQGYSSFQQLPRLVTAWGPASRVPGAMSLARAAMGWQARHSGNARWGQMPDWARTMAGAWWLRRGLYAPADLPALMGPELAAEVLQGFSPDAWVGQMSGALAADGRLAVGQIESTTYLRNQLLPDSDWASMDHSVELRTPLVDAWLLRDMQPLLGAFSQFPHKRLLAEAITRSLPEILINRTKTGFGIPVQAWLSQMGKTGCEAGPSNAWAREVSRVYEGGKL
ncbi:asparagine synthase (glutamine-hydrolyzing) [Limnohabitans sp. WS1]|uniref:asparagine synthase (glutamine-hydrolyzing) n=1 Tax=Limnohabitans sp. WS1 TaxID=1100726 RepID=UPI001E5658EA|nr:asparagine synthase (glutamine-hydrolyzing) [Limnohabitans sp. WS1]